MGPLGSGPDTRVSAYETKPGCMVQQTLGTGLSGSETPIDWARQARRHGAAGHRGLRRGGVVLVAFAIAVIDGNPRVGLIESFFFIAAVMVGGVLATTVAIFLLLFVGNAIGSLRRGVKVRFGRVEARRSIELDCDPDDPSSPHGGAVLAFGAGAG